MAKVESAHDHPKVSTQPTTWPALRLASKPSKEATRDTHEKVRTPWEEAASGSPPPETLPPSTCPSALGSAGVGADPPRPAPQKGEGRGALPAPHSHDPCCPLHR